MWHQYRTSEVIRYVAVRCVSHNGQLYRPKIGWLLTLNLYEVGGLPFNTNAPDNFSCSVLIPCWTCVHHAYCSYVVIVYMYIHKNDQDTWVTTHWMLCLERTCGVRSNNWLVLYINKRTVCVYQYTTLSTMPPIHVQSTVTRTLRMVGFYSFLCVHVHRMPREWCAVFVATLIAWLFVCHCYRRCRCTRDRVQLGVHVKSMNRHNHEECDSE
jgi:hypothetical protein